MIVDGGRIGRRLAVGLRNRNVIQGWSRVCTQGHKAGNRENE